MKLPEEDKTVMKRDEFAESGGGIDISGKPPDPDAKAPAAGEPPNKLTPDEQMALLEKELKDDDWGHQPC
jgi:hypothetical protein